MSEYTLGVFAICLAGGALSMLFYGSGRAESIVIGIVTLYVIVAPIAAEAKSFDVEKWLSGIEISAEQTTPEGNSVIEDAFAEGICCAVAEKFQLDQGDIGVRLTGFDMEKMYAKKIKIRLSGRAALADYKAVERYIKSFNLGECDVEIEIG